MVISKAKKPYELVESSRVRYRHEAEQLSPSRLELEVHLGVSRGSASSALHDTGSDPVRIRILSCRANHLPPLTKHVHHAQAAPKSLERRQQGQGASDQA